MKNIINNNLDILAERLALNMVSSSFPTSYNTKVFDEVLVESMGYRKRSRNILIIGAGASHDLCEYIPLASSFKGILKTKFTDKYKSEFYDKIIEGELKRLTNIYKLGQDEFETQLAAYSKYDKETVLELLNEKYNLRFPISLFYECIAHMFKHRFIDVIVNFNFDEILNSAIEEEMNLGEYEYIYSDGNCPERGAEEDKFIKSGRLRVPIYIKPHGTISHGSTLRFTRHDYYNISTRLKETLSFLIAGKTERDVALPVNLIVVGFGLASFEFNKIISDNMLPEKSALFYFDVFNKEQMEDFNGKKKPKELLPFSNDNSFLFPLNTNDKTSPHSLDNYAYLLWNKISNLYKPGYTPKGIDRHVVISEIFNPIANLLIKKDKNNQADIDKQTIIYLRERIYVELGLEIVNCNDGILNLTHIQQGRVGKYFKLLKKESPEISLFDFLEDLGLKRYRSGLNDTWLTENTYEFKKKINDKVYSLLSNDIKRYTSREGMSDRLRSALKKVKEKSGMFLNIVPSFIENRISMFESINEDNLINTDIKWIYLFKRYFYDQNLLKKWDVVLSISENGSVFSESKIAEALINKKLALICSYNSIEGRDQKYSKLLATKLAKIKNSLLQDEKERPIIKFLSYRNHNQHITLFCKIVSNTLKPIYGIYYQRRLMSRKVSPVVIEPENEKDLHMMKSIFMTYFERAEKEEQRSIWDENLLHIKKEFEDGTLGNLENEDLFKSLLMPAKLNFESYIVERCKVKF